VADDFLHRDVPALRKRVFRMGLAVSHGLDEAGIREALDGEMNYVFLNPTARRLVAPLPVAAVAACVAGALFVFAGHRSTDPLVEEAVRKHARDLPLELSAASVGPEAIPAMLASKLDFNPRPPAFRANGVRLVGARLAQLREWPAAYMRYETPRGPVGLFIIDDPEHRVASGKVIL